MENMSIELSVLGSGFSTALIVLGCLILLCLALIARSLSQLPARLRESGVQAPAAPQAAPAPGSRPHTGRHARGVRNGRARGGRFRSDRRDDRRGCFRAADSVHQEDQSVNRTYFHGGHSDASLYGQCQRYVL